MERAAGYGGVDFGLVIHFTIHVLICWMVYHKKIYLKTPSSQKSKFVTRKVIV